MPEAILSDYFYGDESEQFVFFKIPRQLITDPKFKHISTDAKLLYGMLLDRMSLSAKHGCPHQGRQGSGDPRSQGWRGARCPRRWG